MELSKDVAEYIEDFGAPKLIAAFSEEGARQLTGKFPNDLVEFMNAFGRAVFQDGLIQICHPDDLRSVLALIFGGDETFSHKNCHAYACSAFGEIFCWHRDYGLTVIDAVAGSVTCRLLTKKLVRDANTDRTFITPFGADADYYDVNDKPLFKRAVKKLGSLLIGECYGFVPALALGGSPELQYLKRLRAPEHLAIVAQTNEFNLVDVEGYGVSKVVRKIG